MKAETPSAKRWRFCVIGKTICVKKLRKNVTILGNSMEKTKKNLEMIYFVKVVMNPLDD